MERYYFKFVFALLMLLGCKKESQPDKDFKELYFDAAGKTFSFPPHVYKGVYDNNAANFTYIDIPEGAVEGKQMLEYYRLYCDTAAVKQVYIHWQKGYVHLLSSSSDTLAKTAILKFPMPVNNYSANSSYKPYKVKMQKYQNVETVINTATNRIPVVDYTWDNAGKFIIIRTRDLNAAYFMAASKK